MNSVFNKTLTSSSEVLSTIQNSLITKKKLLLTYFNQHCFNIYSIDKIYHNLLDNKFIFYADGFGIYLVNKFLYNKKYKQFNASDLNDDIFSYLITENIKFYIIGGDFSANVISSKLESVQSFVGYSNGFFLEHQINLISEKINLVSPQVIILGMGVPKQEIIAEKLSNSVDASVFLCVGNFLEFYFGTLKRVPKKYRNKGIEWCFRLQQEPKRLWKRYLIGIPLFIFRVIKSKLFYSKAG